MSTSIDLKGTIIYIGDIIERGNFVFREFVIKTDDEEYPQTIKFRVKKNKFPILEGKAEGSRVVVSYNLTGREWINPQGETIWFNSLDAWSIAITDELSDKQSRDNKVFERIDREKAKEAEEAKDDLPF